MGSYYLPALGIVVAIPIAVAVLVIGAARWAADSMARSPLAGGLGVLGTLVAAGNLFVERTCAGTVNRPIVTAFLGPEACKQSALVAIALVVLLAVFTALIVRTGEIRVRR